MGELKLSGNLNLMGNLTLKDTVLVDGKKALVELTPGDSPHGSSAPIVMIPPPPAGPTNVGMTVWVINSFNKTVKAGTKPIVTMGIAMQGNPAQWPGMVLPSTNNPPPNGVKVNMLPINVEGDKAIIFPSGGSAALDTSGQS